MYAHIHLSELVKYQRAMLQFASIYKYGPQAEDQLVLCGDVPESVKVGHIVAMRWHEDKYFVLPPNTYGGVWYTRAQMDYYTLGLTQQGLPPGWEWSGTVNTPRAGMTQCVVPIPLRRSKRLLEQDQV
jgi:hypothetical protein